MAFWCRIKHSKLKCLSHQFKRCYFQIPKPFLLNYTAPNTIIRILEKPNWVNGVISPKRPTEFCGNNVRFFAAPIQAKPKQEEKDTDGPRINERIRAEFVRLVTDEGHGIVSRREALERARKLNLDLVEVQRTAKPPVCKIMDFHREKYKQQVKEKDRAKGKSEVTLRKGDCKEVRFSGKTEQKDLQMKANMVKRLMERGYRVKCMAMGTEDQDLGGLLSRLSALIEDLSIVESGPRVEKRQAYIIVRHIKFGPSKKGPGKKASRVVATGAEVQKATTLPPTINPSSPSQSPIQFEEFNLAESGSVTEDDILSDEADMPISPSMGMPDKDLGENNTTWSVFDASDDFEKAFDCSDEVNGVFESSTDERMNSAPETASFPENNNISDLLRPRPILDSMRTNKAPSSQPEPPLGPENRYRRSEPRSRFSPEKSMDSKGPGVTDSARLGPQFPNQGRQPRSDLNVSPSTGETKQVGTDASPFRNLRLPSDEIPKQEPPRPSAPSSPAPSYGIFSAQKVNAPGEQGAAVEVNRNKEGNSFDSARNMSPGGVRANPNLPTSKSDSSQRTGGDKGGQGGWGTFSRASSNVIPNRISDSQAKVQR